MTYDQPELISPEEAEKRGIDEGSKIVKQLAAGQKITISLPEEVIEMIKSQSEHWDTSKPAELVFVAGDDARASFRVAAYAYRRTTCCA